MKPSTWLVPRELDGARLDRELARHVALPRNQIQGWIEAGRVFIEGVVADKTGRTLRSGETVSWEPPPPKDVRLEGEPGDLALLHLDDHLIVLDKPPGLAMHPGAGRSTATLAHRLLGRFPELAGVGGPGRPGIVHRLDKDTSGVLAVARTSEAYQALASAFAARRVEKRYLAIVSGGPKAPTGTIDRPIGRHAVKRKQMTVRADGRCAVTRYRTLATSTGFSLLELELLTGRTHQIRVHLQHLGHPIAGDPTYGGGERRSPSRRHLTPPLPRLALHAWRLAFEHPGSGDRVEYCAPFAADLITWWRVVSGTDPLLALERQGMVLAT